MAQHIFFWLLHLIIFLIITKVFCLRGFSVSKAFLPNYDWEQMEFLLPVLQLFSSHPHNEWYFLCIFLRSKIIVFLLHHDLLNDYWKACQNSFICTISQHFSEEFEAICWYLQRFFPKYACQRHVASLQWSMIYKDPEEYFLSIFVSLS